VSAGVVDPDDATIGPVGQPEADVARLPPRLRAAGERLLGARLPVAEEYARLLVTDGVVRGLLGPHEASRIWDRHILNCAAVAEMIRPNATIIDVGSGAGLPGMVLAVARPDLSVILLEPLARRSEFLSEVVAALGLTRTGVVRARAEECVGARGVRLPAADAVTARAVAPLDQLAAWCLPLAAEGGRLLALKGSSAADEVADHRAVIRRLGGSVPVLRRCGGDVLAEPTTVIEITRIGAPDPAVRRAAGRRRARR
jgi:16S rRNA (guanine527-N7)-methyltransferase